MGTNILAPGFTMEFKNNFASIDGAVAVKSLIAKNNLAAIVSGTIMTYGGSSTEGVVLKNNDSMRVDRSRNSGVAPGFQGYNQPTLIPNPDTYTEQ